MREKRLREEAITRKKNGVDSREESKKGSEK